MTFHLQTPTHHPPDHPNTEHIMDWLVWLFILAVVAAIVLGIPALIIYLIVRANRRRRNGTL